MSHYRKIQTTMNDRDALVAALRELGIEPQIHEQAVDMIGTDHNGQTQQAHVIVTREQIYKIGHASYSDVGWRFNDDGTVDEVIDEWRVLNSQGQRVTARDFVNALRQPYTVARVNQELQRANVPNGRIASQVKQDDGSVKIVIKANRPVQVTSTAASTGIAARRS